jgi:uncharacterized protein involved in exopolysaccharide biosynthesis
MPTLVAAERPNPELSSSEMHVNRFLRPFRRYWRLFLTFAVVLAVFGALTLLILPRSYTEPGRYRRYRSE